MEKRGGVQTGHKLFRGGGGKKITVHSSDEDSDYSNEKQPSDGSVDVPATTLKERKKSFSPSNTRRREVTNFGCGVLCLCVDW